MNIYTSTKRLILRELVEEDAPGILAMDRGCRSAPISFPSIPSIASPKQRRSSRISGNNTKTNGIGRWAMERKEDGAFMGWCGIKLVNDRPTNGRLNYYDIGYRMLPAYWGKGYAFEAAAACKAYAFSIAAGDAACHGNEGQYSFGTHCTKAGHAIHRKL